MISLVLCSYRPGGFDILCHSLQETLQGTDQTIEWEFIVIDDYPGRVERGVVEKRILSMGLPLTCYRKSKNKFYSNVKGGLCNAWNSALLHCRGERIVFVSDYTWLPPYWIRAWDHLHKQFDDKTLISGSAIVYETPKPTLVDDFSTWKIPPPLIPKWPWVPREWETFYVSITRDFFDIINGVDERADHCHCWPVTSKMAQAKMLGYKLEVDQEIAVCHMVDHRVWDTPQELSPLGNEGMWRITHISSAPEEPKWEVPSPNPWNLVEERKRISGI